MNRRRVIPFAALAVSEDCFGVFVIGRIMM